MTYNFPAVASSTSMAERMANSKIGNSPGGGGGEGSYLKMDFNTGDFSLGKDNDDVTDEIVLIHSSLIAHGWAAWVDNKPQKVFRPFDEDLPPEPEALVDSRGNVKPFKQARLLVGAFDDGEMFTYDNNSVGCEHGVDDLAAAIRAKSADLTEFWCPKVRLTSKSYPGTGERSGKLNYEPRFEVIAWCDIDGNEEGKAPAQIAADPDPDPVVEPEVETDVAPEAEVEAPKPRQRRKRKANAVA